MLNRYNVNSRLTFVRVIHATACVKMKKELKFYVVMHHGMGLRACFIRAFLILPIRMVI